MIIEAGRLCKHKEGSDPSIEAGPRSVWVRAKSTRGNYAILGKIAHFRGILLDFPAGKMHTNIHNIYRFVRR